MDEPDAAQGDRNRDRDVEREQPPRNRRYTDRKPGEPEKRDPRRPTSDDERIDEASEESFPASDPPQQP